jgi:hypothetical protein
MRRFAQRLGVSASAGAILFGVTTGAWLLVERVGLVERRRKETAPEKPEPTVAEMVGLACVTGAFFGAGYGVVRPLLPNQPELAGLSYAVAEGLAVRAQANVLLRVFRSNGRRPLLSASRIASDVVWGLWLAQAERVFGPRVGK